MAPSHAASLAVSESRWPGVLGVLGIVLGCLTIFDKISDLFLLLVMSRFDWSRFVPADIDSLLETVMPPAGWLVVTSLVWLALGALLLKASLDLRLRRGTGVRLSRLWAMLSIAWITFDCAVGLWWFTTIADELAAVAPGDWQGTVLPGALLVLAVLLAYPVFLIVWLGRPPIAHEHAGWPE